MEKNKKFKVLVIATDNASLIKGSRLESRVIYYGSIVDKYTIIVPNNNDEHKVLSDKVDVYGVGGKNKVIKLFKIYKQGKKILRQEQYTIITVQDQYYLGFIAWLLARKFKIGLEIQNHGFEKFNGLRKLIAKFIFPRANSVRTMSNRLKNRLIGEFGVKEERISIVPMFFKSQEDYQKREKVISDKFIFLTVGRLVPIKNIEMQIRAMKDIVEINKNVELWILGQGPLGKKLHVLAKYLNIEENIKFLGWRDNVMAVYRQADAFLLTSYSEGWPVSVLEAAGAGLPIIMTDVGSAGELIINNENGIVIPVKDQEALKKAMISLLDNKDFCDKLGKAARKTIDGLPTKEENLKLYKNSWEKAIIK